MTIPGAKPRAILTLLGLRGGSIVSAGTLIELLWGEDPPRTAAKALQTHISTLRRALGDGFVLTEGAGWTLAESEVDASRYKSAARLGRDAAAAGDPSQAVARFEEALALWRGIPELPDGRRGTSEKTRWIEGHAALEEDRADALLATGRATEIVGELEAAVADAPLRERRWGQLMLALYRAGRQGEALGAYQRARALLADELGVDPGLDLRRLEAAIVAQDASLDLPGTQDVSSVTRAVTFLLTDIEGSTAAWEAQSKDMALALARHDELVEQVVTSRGGRLIKTRGEGDATFSVFERPSTAAAAAIELQEAIGHELWSLREPLRIRMALHTGEVELRDGDYFGRAVNRAARLRSLAVGGQILCSGATAELVIDSLRDDVVLADLGMRELRNLARPEHVFELRLETADDHREAVSTDPPVERPRLPTVLAGPGPFVGREQEFARLFAAWQTSLAGATNAVLIAGEPGVGKTRLAGEWSRQAYEQGALVVYGRCDEDLGAPYQPFAEALRALVPCLGSSRLRGLRGAEALLPLVPGLTDMVPDLTTPARADPDTERYALFDAVVALLGLASQSAPVVLVLDDLHWAAKPTLLLLRHLLRFGEHARVQILGTYRSTDLDRSHPLAATLADLHRDGTADRIALSGLDEDDVTAYVAEAGYDDEELARALASVTGGNPFFLIEALRHVDESGGHWDPGTLPQGVREAVSRRLTRLPPETNKALAAAAVVGSRFGLELVERVVEADLVDSFDEACKAGIVIEESSGRYRFNHAIVRQSLLAELPSVRRLRLHQRIATTLETLPGADDELLAELAHHYYECAWAGNAAKAVEYCRRAADQAVARLAYEGAADLYGQALHALEEIDEELPDRDVQAAELLVARCETLLAAGDVASAASAVSQLQDATVDSARLAAWATCFDGQLSILIHPERLDEVEAALASAARKLAELDDAAGEANAHTIRAACLARLGRIGDSEIALDEALTAARRARDHRRVNAVLAGAPLAALWGPNPVPRAGGRCLDVVRLLRITTDSPAVEATSTRCQAVLEAFRGRAPAARRMIDSARRTVTELGLRHASLEVEQFAGIVELVADDPAAAEPHLRQAYNGFRRMGLDADTAETAALLGRTCLALNRKAEADELCTESERLAGHALKPSIASRTLRAKLLSRGNDQDVARRVAQDAVRLAERTDALVDHGDACASLAAVLRAAGDVAGARAAAERAVDLYERKGAAALAERARLVLMERTEPAVAPTSEAPSVEPDNACARAGKRAMASIDRQDWDEFERVFAPGASIESRRKIVGFKQNEFRSDDVIHQTRLDLETGSMRLQQVIVAVRGERLALARMVVGTPDVSPGAPQDEFLTLFGIDDEGRISLQIWFDVDDVDAALAELDSAHSRFGEEPKARRLQNTASRANERFLASFAARDWDALTEIFAAELHGDDRRAVVGVGLQLGRDALITHLRTAPGLEVTQTASDAIATRGDRLVLTRNQFSRIDDKPDAFRVELLHIVETDADERISVIVAFDSNDFDDAMAELDARYLAGEAAPHAHTWSLVMAGHAALNRRELPPVTPDGVSIDHRRGATFAPGELIEYLRAGIDLDQNIQTYVETVHRLNDLGALCTHAGYGISGQGFDAEWRGVDLLMVDGVLFNRCEIFDEADLDSAIARFDQLSRIAPHLENAATRVFGRLCSCVATGDWHAVAQMTAENVCVDDRRRVVNAGILHGRDANIKGAQATAAVGFSMTMLDVLATRSGRLALTGVRVSGRDPEAIQNDALQVVEIDAEERIAGVVVFDLDEFDSAVAELDARYLAGEAAAHSDVWSVIAGAYAALNRHELPATTTNLVDIDHRGESAFGHAALVAYVRAGRDASQYEIYVESVHRLNSSGAVFTYVAHERSQEGFDAEWCGVNILMVEGNLIKHSEVFDAADLDTAIARFERLSMPAPRLENAASRVDERFQACFATRDWNGMGEILADDISADDRRRVVNAGIRHGRDFKIADMRATADLGTTKAGSTVIAIRGQRLALVRIRLSGRDRRPDAFHTEMLGVVEVNADDRMAARVLFDPDDFEAAITELDARYLAGEAAAYAHSWSAIVWWYAALNRHQMPLTTPDWANADHRRGRSFEAGDLPAFLRATWDLMPEAGIYVEAVHRLNDLGALVTHASQGMSPDGFEATWREISVKILEGGIVSRSELFDEVDLDAAVARFDQLSRPAPRLENAASQVGERFLAQFVSRDWDALAEILADNFSNDDRRRVVGAGILGGRSAQIANMRATAELWITNTKVASIVMATRGSRIVLMRGRFSHEDEGSEASITELLSIVEINADERIVALVTFDNDDIDAAFEELDAGYIAGEAAAHAHTWSSILQAYAAFNHRSLPATTPDWTSVDHRRFGTIEPKALTPNIRAWWDITSETRIDIEAVHRLTDLGAVVTHIHHATWDEGAEIESREIVILTLEGGLLSRCEIFDEARLDTALARFDELHTQARRLENAASRIVERYQACFSSRDWAAMAELLADDIVADDRRRVVNGGTRRGRDLHIADTRAGAEVGAQTISSSVIATRGERLVLDHLRTFNRNMPSEAGAEMVGIAEIDADARIIAFVIFDSNDIDAAFAELDARYFAGEGAAYSQTWSIITRTYAAINRHELPVTTPDWVGVDNRPLRLVQEGDLGTYLRATWNVTPDINLYVEAVHDLSNHGAVVTRIACGTSQAGFAAESRQVDVLTIAGGLLNRLEVFDEGQLEAALERFAELRPHTPRLDNAAGRIFQRYQACFSARDWAEMAQLLADDVIVDDRRRVVNAGVRRGRDVHIADSRSAVEVGAETTSSRIIATRGERLSLAHLRTFNRGMSGGVGAEMLVVAEIDADERIIAGVISDLDDIDAAYEELDARYLAGEGAAHPHAWSVIAKINAAFNRHQITAADWITIDRRRVVTTDMSNLPGLFEVIWDLTPDLSIQIEAVHRLSGHGAVVTRTAYGTSRHGLYAEWRMIHVLIVEGDRIGRCEVFDEGDLDAALARFDELHPQTRRPENAASQLIETFRAYFAARNWAAIGENSADNIFTEDRRSVVGSGILRGRDLDVANIRAIADLGATDLTSTVIATRGEHLVLSRLRLTGRDQRPDAFHSEMLGIVEINADNRVAARFLFDLDDIDAAFAELDARYLAGEGAACSRVWSAITSGYAALNRHDVPATTPDWVNVDHRRGIAFASGDLAPYIRATFDVAPDIKIRIEAVHRLTSYGAVLSYSGHGTSQEGFDAVWRETALFTVDGGLVSRCEMYDEGDLDAALARFEELQPPAQRLENAASQVSEHFLTLYAARDWDAMAELLADDSLSDDRRRVVGAGLQRGRDAQIADMRAITDLWIVTNLKLTVIATRGERLVLTRTSFSGREQGSEPFLTEVLNVAEINSAGRYLANVSFDFDDLDAAFAELDTRYLAGEAAAHSPVWSVVARDTAAFTRHEVPQEDMVIIDHRRLAPVDASHLPTAVREICDLTPDFSTRVEAVHRLSDFGAVVSRTAYGTSRHGLEAEWRMIHVLGVEGDRINRCEIFDEADLEAALARFDELHPTPRPENAASEVVQHFLTAFRERDWNTMAELLSDDCSTDDRRPVVNAGVRHGRDAEMANMRALADVGVTNMTQTVIAIRGSRLVLGRHFGADDWSGHEELGVCEINAEDQLVARVDFGFHDIDAAFEELEARYLAGDAAAHANTWSVIAGAYVSFNKHEVPATTPDSVAIEHRSLLTTDAVDLAEAIRAVWDLTPDARMEIEAVHRLSELGAVVTCVLKGTSPEGLDAEWRMIDVFTIEGNSISRIEVFDETDLGAALARFDELHPKPQLENTASRVGERFLAHFRRRDWDGMAEMLADEFAQDDRRRVVGAGIRYGRNAQIADLRVIADLRTTYMTSTVIATRGEHLAITRQCLSFRDEGQEGFLTDVLVVMEINADKRIAASVSFNSDDIDAAFEELDARYLAGEAAAHARFWSVIINGYATLNNHELPPVTSKWMTIDHRMRATFQAADQTAYIRGAWDLTPNLKMYIEAVHRLSDHSAVVTHAAYGSTHEGFAAEWRMIGLLVAEDDDINRCELFDEADIDSALARFDELDRPAPKV